MGSLSISKLSDVLYVPLKTRLSVFCTVVECQSLSATSTGRFSLCLRLSCVTMEETIEACVFVPKKSVQIFIKKPGDVAFIRNAIVDVYQSERQLKIQLDYKDCGLAFFDTMASVKPYLQYGLPLEMDSSLSEMLNLAKQFGNLWKADCPNFYVSETECTLEEIQGKEPTQIFDVSCKVISVNVDHDPKLFWIWDGTDVKAEFIRKSNCPDNIWLGPTFNKNCSSLPVPIAENTETQIPSMGTFVPVAVIGERHLLTFPKGWIKLRNLSFVRYQNQIIVSTFLFLTFRKYVATLRRGFTLGTSSRNPEHSRPLRPTFRKSFVSRCSSQKRTQHRDWTFISSFISASGSYFSESSSSEQNNC